jgi:sigma-B regulation protein RsbU (phosphoserine phosphatase)
LRTDGKIQSLEIAGGIALGVIEEVAYDIERIELQPGDGIFLYTDGVTEAFNAEGVMYTNQRLEQLLTGQNSQPIKEIVQKVFQDVSNFSTGIEQSDDITILAMRRTVA